MERHASLFARLKGKEQGQEAAQSNGGITVTNALGAMVSVAILTSMLASRPSLWLWIAGIAGVVLAVKLLQPQIKAHQERSTPINFFRLKNHPFSSYLNWIKSLHLGHDPEVTRFVKAISRDLSLAMPGKVMGVHLLAGPHGTGKTQLSQLFAQALFGKQNVILFDFKILDSELFAELFIEMLESVNKNPYQLILLENFEYIQPGMLEPILEILKTSQWQQRKEGPSVSFSACTFIALVSLPTPESDLHSDGFLDERYLSHCSEVISWKQLPYRVLAELATRQISEHWAQHQIEVAYVSPKAIVSILKDLKPRESQGMHPYPQVIRQKSAQAIEIAIKMQRNRINLELDSNGLFTQMRGAA